MILVYRGPHPSRTFDFDGRGVTLVRNEPLEVEGEIGRRVLRSADVEQVKPPEDEGADASKGARG